MGNEISQGHNDKKRPSNTTATKPTSNSKPNSNPINKSYDDQKQTPDKISPQYEYVDKKIDRVIITPQCIFKTGNKIDARDKNGIWRQYTILDISKRKNFHNICAILRVAAVNSDTIMKIEVTTLNICLCNEYCFKYNPTQLTWSNHMVAAPDTQSEKWNSLQMSLFNNVKTNSNQKQKGKVFKLEPIQPLHFKFTLIVFGYMRQNYEQQCNQLIPMDIKQLIYMFWEYWSRLKVNDTLRIKHILDDKNIGKWQGVVVRYAKIVNNYFQIMYAYCPNILKVGDHIDAKDNDGKWYVAKIIAIKRAKKKFPMDAPKKKKKKLKKFAAIYVHFLEFGDRFNEWIYMKDGVMCSCAGKCYDKDHRITFAKTQSDGIGTFTGYLNVTENKFCNCFGICGNNEHRLTYTENYELERSSNMFCFC